MGGAPVLTPWDIFVLRHRRPLNLVIHFISLLCFYGGLGLAAGTRDWHYLLPFFASGLIGAFGHFVSGDGGVSVRETTSTPTVVVFVPWLFFRLFTGRYGADIARAEARYQRGGPL